MKKFTFLFLALTTIVAVACRSKCCVVGPKGNYINAQIGTKDWSATPENASVDKDSLYLFGHIGEETLQMHIKFTGKGKYQLSGNQANYKLTVGQDVVINEYTAESDAENVLDIGFYDQDAKIITGSFTLNLIQSSYFVPKNNNPQKLSVTKGLFKIQLAK